MRRSGHSTRRIARVPSAKRVRDRPLPPRVEPRLVKSLLDQCRFARTRGGDVSALIPKARFVDNAVDDVVDAPAIRSFLVATDLSEEARLAVDRFAQLSAQLGTLTTLLHVEKSSSDRRPDRRIAPLRHATTSSAYRTLNLTANELTVAHGIEVRAETRRGDVCEQILLMSGSADVVAMASKRRNPLHRLVFGSIPGRLLDRCRRPMLVVKQAPRGAYRSVVVLTDFSAGSIAAAELAASIAPEAELHLFHAIDLREETEMRFAEVPESVIRKQRLKRRAAAQVRMDRALESIGASSSRFAHGFGHGDVVPLAMLKQQALDADLLVVARRSRPATRSFLFWSIARRLSDDCPCDVLVVPTRDADWASQRSTDAYGNPTAAVHLAGARSWSS